MTKHTEPLALHPTILIVDAEAMHAEHPDTFHLPSPAQLDALADGSDTHAKIALTSGGITERVWARVVGRFGGDFAGVLDSGPLAVGLDAGDTVNFQRRHIYATARIGDGRRGEPRAVAVDPASNRMLRYDDGSGDPDPSETTYGEALVANLEAEAVANRADLAGETEISDFVAGFVRRFADESGLDPQAVARDIHVEYIRRLIVQQLWHNTERVRDALLAHPIPAALGGNLDQFFIVCGGAPFGHHDGPDAGRVITIGDLTAQDLRLMVFDLVADAPEGFTWIDVVKAAKHARDWIGSLGDRTYRQWLASTTV